MGGEGCLQKGYLKDQKILLVLSGYCKADEEDGLFSLVLSVCCRANEGNPLFYMIGVNFLSVAGLVKGILCSI